jgi:hypothetical protein
MNFYWNQPTTSSEMIDKPDTPRPNTIWGIFRGNHIIWMRNFEWKSISQFVQSGRGGGEMDENSTKTVNATHQTMEKTVKITSKTTNWRTGKARYTFCFIEIKGKGTLKRNLFKGSTLIRRNEWTGRAFKWYWLENNVLVTTNWGMKQRSRYKKEKFGKKSNKKLRSGGKFQFFLSQPIKWFWFTF